MSPLQSWSMIFVLIVGAIAGARLLAATPDEWRQLFTKQNTPERGETETENDG